MNIDTRAGLKDHLAKIKEKDLTKSRYKERALGVGLKALAKNIEKHFNKESTQNNKLNTCCHLIGEQAVSLARSSFRLVVSLHDNGETTAQKQRDLFFLSCVKF